MSQSASRTCYLICGCFCRDKPDLSTYSLCPSQLLQTSATMDVNGGGRYSVKQGQDSWLACYVPACQMQMASSGRPVRGCTVYCQHESGAGM